MDVCNNNTVTQHEVFSRFYQRLMPGTLVKQRACQISEKTTLNNSLYFVSKISFLLRSIVSSIMIIIFLL